MSKVFIVSVFVLLVVACQSQPENTTLKQKIGQMLMIGFRGTEITDTNHICTDIKDLNIGGVILYEYDGPMKSRPRNISSANQLQQLNSQLQKLATTPLFIGIDEEGGRVSRLKPKYGFADSRSPQYLGQLNNDDSTRFFACQIAKECKQMGINLNFAPLVDMNVNPDCPVIGKLERSFSANADTVVHLAKLFIDEHQQQGVFCSIKHFPGHGSAHADSHLGFTDITQTWTSDELQPYRILLSDSTIYPMVMTAHVFNARLDSVYPATLSKDILAILRDSLNYQGLILSDDMMMHAISQHYGLDEALEKSINAGVDVLLFSNNIEVYDEQIAQKVIDIIFKLVQSGKISEQRIDESYRRIMVCKALLRN